jgi:hypothetical protein
MGYWSPRTLRVRSKFWTWYIDLPAGEDTGHIFRFSLPSFGGLFKLSQHTAISVSLSLF